MIRLGSVCRLMGVLVLFGCGGAPSKAKTSRLPKETPKRQQKASATELLGLSGPETPWATMTREEREWYMVGKVLPIMKETFQRYDPRAYADFKCETCHGPDGKGRAWAMPSPALPRLGESGSEENRRILDEHPEMMLFMATEVTPITQQLLGLEPYDPATGEGFGCGGCHPGSS